MWHQVGWRCGQARALKHRTRRCQRGWAAYAHEMQSKKRLALWFRRRTMFRELAAAMAGWSESAAARRATRHVLHTAVARLRHRELDAAVAAWAAHAHYAQHTRHTLALALERRRRRQLSAARIAWAGHVVYAQRTRRVVAAAVVRLRRRELARGLESWAQWLGVVQWRRQVLGDSIARMAHSTATAAFWAWAVRASELRHEAVVGSLVVARLLELVTCRVAGGWLGVVLRRRQLRQAVLHWRGRQAAAAWEVWAVWVVTRRRRRQDKTCFLRWVVERLLRRVFAGWNGRAEGSRLAREEWRRLVGVKAIPEARSKANSQNSSSQQHMTAPKPNATPCRAMCARTWHTLVCA